MDRNRNIAAVMLLYQWVMSHLDQASTVSALTLSSWMEEAQALVGEFDGRMERQVGVWSYNRPGGFMEVTLMQSFNDYMFKRRVRVSRPTFHYLCTVLGPFLKREDTRMRQAVPVEKKVAMALTRLATGNTLKDIGDTYSVGYTTVQRAVVEFCACVKEHLEPMCIRWPSIDKMEELANGFEKIRGIPFIVGAVDGSHLPIIAPCQNPQDYYNRKGFHSVLLQAIVGSDCSVWDYDVGWAGSLHDWKLFQQSKAGQRVASGQLGMYCLVGDAAYPPRPWMLPPYKGHRDGLTDVESNWNYIQSSTRMPVECTFGQLKARWRILLKRMDFMLDNVPNVVSTCLVLHNLCLRHKDSFDRSWVDEATKEMEKSIEDEKLTKKYTRLVMKAKKLKSQNIPTTEIAEAARYIIHRVKGVQLNPLEALERALEDDTQSGSGRASETANRTSFNKRHADSGAENASRRNAIARVMHEKKTAELVHAVFGVGH